jgi:hypothetical protein
MTRTKLTLALASAALLGAVARNLVPSPAQADAAIDRAQVDRILRALEKSASADEKSADALRDLVQATERCK